MSRWLIVASSELGSAERMRKATAATSGDEKDVPEPEPYSEGLEEVGRVVLTMPTPGATTSTQLP